MELLKKKILEDGIVLPGNILKVDSFLNHQIDTKFVGELAKEFGRLFAETNVTKILTVEASGIAIAYASSHLFDDCPVVYAKKGNVSTMSKVAYTSKIHSYTHNEDYMLNVSKRFLTSEDRVLLIDDFLANGEALNGLLDICEQSGCEVVGAGIVIEKEFQGGGNLLRERGVRVESLARIKSMSDTDIEFF